MENESKKEAKINREKIKAKRERNRTECERWLLGERWICWSLGGHVLGQR